MTRYVPIFFTYSLPRISRAATKGMPLAPPEIQPPDTTSHDWEFTLYEVGGINTVLTDVCALFSDYARAVAKVEGVIEWRHINACRLEANGQSKTRRMQLVR